MTEMTLVNLTPHAINMIVDGDVKETIVSSGLARCSVMSNVVGQINGYNVCENTYGEVVGLPQPQEGTIYIVSALVAQAVKGLRTDVVVVDKTVRNESGQIIGCTGFARI